jgi:hypothetical protein
MRNLLMARKALIANCKSEPRSALWDGEVRFDPLALRVVGDIPCALSVSLITGNGRVERVLIVAEDLRSRPAKMASDLWKQRRSPVTLPICYICHVNTKEIITALDAEIVRLQHARSLIVGSGEPKRRGRPAKSAPSTVPAPKKRKLSPEARKKIAAAQKKRWAKQRAAKPVHVTKVPAKKQPEKRVRAAKKGTAQDALSSRSETVAAAAKS